MRIRLRRMLLAMSQEQLGDALGLTFQQVQKYERGVNRVGASRLVRPMACAGRADHLLFWQHAGDCNGPNSAASRGSVGLSDPQDPLRHGTAGIGRERL
jgi:hypothetical protein